VTYIYESVKNCGEMFVMEGAKNLVITLYCDECNEKHQFMGRNLTNDEWKFYVLGQYE